MMLIDAHTHLNTDRLFPNRNGFMKNFESIGGKILVNAGANEFYNKKGIEIAEQAKTDFPDLIVKSAVGRHPCDIPNNEQDFLPLLKDLENYYLQFKEYIIAIGECGIDLHFPENPPVRVQQNALNLQAKLARQYNLPLMIHSREGFNETIEVLQDFTDLKIYFHSRGYGKDELEKAENIFPNFWIGCTNVIAYPSAQNIREAITNTTNAKILTETDAPYLPPQCFRGQQNEPAYVSYVYDKLCEILNVKRDDLETIIKYNFQKLYGI